MTRSSWPSKLTPKHPAVFDGRLQWPALRAPMRVADDPVALSDHRQHGGHGPGAPADAAALLPAMRPKPLEDVADRHRRPLQLRRSPLRHFSVDLRYLRPQGKVRGLAAATNSCPATALRLRSPRPTPDPAAPVKPAYQLCLQLSCNLTQVFHRFW